MWTGSGGGQFAPAQRCSPRWGTRSGATATGRLPTPSATNGASPSTCATFRPRRSSGLRPRHLAFEELLQHGSADRPDAIIETDAGTLTVVVYDGRPLAEALRSGDLKLEGDREAVARFFGLFFLPESAALDVGA